MPQAKDWEQFWIRESAQKFGNISWSKKRIIRVLDKYGQSGQKALDAGCGSGFFSAYFGSRGLKTTALDYSDQALAMAQKATAGQARTVKANFLEVALTSVLTDSFDIIFTDGLFEHFPAPDQDRIMKNLVSVLADQGAIVTFVPNRWSPWELIRPFYMPGIKEVPFLFKELMDLNTRNGLKVLDAGGVNTVPFRYSPDKFLGRNFGMLLYTVARKR